MRSLATCSGLGRIRIAIRWVVGLVATAALGGCILFDAQSARTAETFPEAVGICRMRQPGRMNRRVHLPPTHPGVAGCLRRRGWNPDGSRIVQPSPSVPRETSASASPRE